jgi:transposase
MAKRVTRAYEPGRPLPLPADLRAWLPADHTVYLLSDIVDQLDLTPITAVYDRGDGGGNPPYHPVLLTKLLFYAYCRGVVSSRVIAAKTYEDVAFRVVTADQHPNFRTISDFRERHLAALGDLFRQTVRLAGRLGLVELEHVAQDGTKILANASKHRAMSYARMQQAETRLSEEIGALLAAAQAADAREDAQYGPERTGDELPADLAGEVGRRGRRLATIRAAKAALEREAGAAAEAVRAADQAERQRRAEVGEPKNPGCPPDPPETPEDTAQRNFTDPESRIMKNSDRAFVQAYNAQAAVDASGSQIIVGCALTNRSADAPHLGPMLEQVLAATGSTPKEWSSDAGYFSADNVAVLEQAGIAAFIPPGRQAHASQLPSPGVAAALAAGGLAPPEAPEKAVPPGSVQARMRATLATPEGRAAYAKRKRTVEPVFGQIEECRGLRRFLLRGLQKVTGEWTLWCLTHNLRKLVQALRTRSGLPRRRACASPAAQTCRAPRTRRPCRHCRLRGHNHRSLALLTFTSSQTAS